MGVIEEDKIELKSTHISLFRFELSRTQTVIFLILSLIGTFMLPFILVREDFFYLFNSIFWQEPWLYENYAYFITSIIVNGIFLFLSVYALRKILRSKNNRNNSPRKLIRHDRIVRWLGFKLSHGQSLFIFSLSLAGILLIVPHYIYSSTFNSGFSSRDLLHVISMIPTSPTQRAFSDLLMENVPFVICAFFVVICLYSLIATQIGRSRSPSKKGIKKIGLLVFITSFVISIFLIARVFSHLAIFNPELSYLLKTALIGTTSYQKRDFILTIVSLIICFILMIASYFMKSKSTEKRVTNHKLTWLHIELTPHRALILFTIAIHFIIYVSFLYLSFVFSFGIPIRTIDYYDILFLAIPIIIIIFCYYPIGKIVKHSYLDTVVNKIVDLDDFETKWFNYRLKRLYGITFLSASSGFIVFLIFDLAYNEFLATVNTYELHLLISSLVIAVLTFLLIAVNIYTIKKTISSIKSITYRK
ncbi:hypothetical protein LCGC14_0723860 [marine sediment metagenome]|uniref:Uncharacterized protein n=1 Tax=marine sediment metagenome TaxID=412755 RepID=A0A0F9QBP1_9ZZZZ